MLAIDKGVTISVADGAECNILKTCLTFCLLLCVVCFIRGWCDMTNNPKNGNRKENLKCRWRLFVVFVFVFCFCFCLIYYYYLLPPDQADSVKVGEP